MSALFAPLLMFIDWSLFVPGAVLLLLPAEILLSQRVELRTLESFHTLENSPRFRPWWWVPALWIDPARGLVGAWLLKRSLAATPAGGEWIQQPQYWVVAAILLIATLAQTMTKPKREALLAPIGFVAGAAFAFVPWTVALIGVVSALTAIFAFRRFYVFFLVGAAVIPLIGLALKTSLLWLAPVVVMFALPVLIAITLGQTLELPVRNTTRRHRSSPPSF
jgi:hypothetical protein